MDEKGAVNRARGELERRRQEAYRARAAATIKIQRWYRQRRASRARTPTNDGDVRSLDSLQLPTEESCTESTSTISHQEDIEGIRHMVSDVDDKESSNDNPVQNRNAWSSSSQLQERTSSFDEFVNSEVAVARAMVDDRYMENLNDAQKKRVERLKAYQKTSDNQMAASEILQNESPNVLTGSSPPSNSSNVSQLAVEDDVSGHKYGNLVEEVAAGKTKRSIPVRNNKKPLPNSHKKGIKTEVAKKAEAQNKPQMTKQIEPPMQDVNAQVPTRKRKPKLSKPTSNQKKQWMMNEQSVVQKQLETKEHRQLEQPDSIDQANGDAGTEPVKATKDLVKIGDKSELASVNDMKFNMQELEGDITTEHTLKDDNNILPSSSSEDGTQAIQQTKAGVHMPGLKDERKQTRKTRSKGQRAGQKVLKFVTNITWQNSNSTVHDPSTKHPKTKPRGIVKQPVHPITAEMDQSQLDEELPPLKKSSATTRLMLEYEDVTQSDSGHLLKQRYRTTTKEISSDSGSFPNLGQSPCSSKSNKRPIEAQRQRIIDAALDNIDDSDSDDGSPDIQSQTARDLHVGAKFASQGGGYGAAYAKRRETNRKRIIRSLRTPQCKPKEKKEPPAGYLQKFLRSSMVQNYLDDLVTSSAPPGYSSGKGSWHTAWTSMGGLPRPGVGGLHTPPDHSPPPQEWVSVMNHASSLSSFEGSYNSPLHHHLAHRRRRPHHLHPLDAPAGNKQLRTSKTGHPKSYTYHYNQQLRLQQAVQQPGNHSQLLSLSNHRRSLSHVIPRSWRRELYYEPDMTYNRYRGAI